MHGLIFMGTPEFAVPALAALGDGPLPIAAVYTQPDRPAGRGQKLTPSHIKAWALAHGLPVFQPPSLRAPAAVEEMRALAPEIIVVAAYGKLLPDSILAIPLKTVLNLHPSLLPRYRGASPIAFPILNGDQVTGVTIMQVDSGVDSGPILAQRRVTIGPRDTAGTLGTTLAETGAELLRETLGRWLHGEIVPSPQNESQATVTKRLEKEDGGIDWRAPAVDIERRIRAFTPWPGCYTKWRAATLRILEADLPPADSQSASAAGLPVGSVAPLRGGAAVMTGDGLLQIVQLQPEGRQKMTAREFLASRRDFVGSVLPS